MITTNRTHIRLMNPFELPDLRRELYEDKEIYSLMLGLPDVKDLTNWFRALRDTKSLYSVIDKRLGEMIGILILNSMYSTVDIGGWLFKDFRKIGIAKEVYDALEKYLFEDVKKMSYTNVHKLTANCLSTNNMAIRTLESLHFKKICTLREHACLNGKYVDIELYEKFRD